MPDVPGLSGRKLFGLVLLTGLLAAALMAGCSGSDDTQQPPDQRYGHRYEGRAPDGRRTLTLASPDTAATFFYYPAPIGEVIVRSAPLPERAAADTARVPAEVLVKGTLPDACMDLARAEQKRRGHLLEVTLMMRRPRGAVCEPLPRPYRFYLSLEGRYEAGPYTLKVNDVVYPFTIHPE